MGVNIPTWFNIQIKHHWTEGPNNFLFQLKLLRKQRKEIEAVTPYRDRHGMDIAKQFSSRCYVQTTKKKEGGLWTRYYQLRVMKLCSAIQMLDTG